MQEEQRALYDQQQQQQLLQQQQPQQQQAPQQPVTKLAPWAKKGDGAPGSDPGRSSAAATNGNGGGSGTLLEIQKMEEEREREEQVRHQYSTVANEWLLPLDSSGHSTAATLQCSFVEIGKS